MLYLKIGLKTQISSKEKAASYGGLPFGVDFSVYNALSEHAPCRASILIHAWYEFVVINLRHLLGNEEANL